MFGVPGVGPVVGRWGAGSAPAVQAGLYGVLALCGIFGRWGAGTATPPPTPTQAMGGGVRLAKLVVRDIRDDEDAIFLMLAAVADLDS